MGVAVVLGEVGMLEIVEGAALQGSGRERKAGGVDDVDAHAQAGPQAEQGAGILGDVGLIQRQVDGRLLLTFSRKLSGSLLWRLL